MPWFKIFKERLFETYFHVNHLVLHFKMHGNYNTLSITHSDFTYFMSFPHEIVGGIMEKSKACEEYGLRVYDANWYINASHPVDLRCITALQVYGC